MTGRVAVVRHAEPDYGAVLGLGTGSAARNVAPLTPAGIEQARQRGLALRRFEVGRVVSSPLTRTFQTAVLIAEQLGLTVELDVGLRDWDSGTDGTEGAFAAAARRYRESEGHPGIGEVWESRERLEGRQ